VTSALHGFHRLTVAARRAELARLAGLQGAELEALANGGLPLEQADLAIENVVGTIAVPVGIATNFVVDGVERLVPMAVEEASVVAAASNGARLARVRGGFTTEAGDQLMIGQVQVVGLRDPAGAAAAVTAAETELLATANACDPVLVRLGGGARRIETRFVDASGETMLVCHLLVDCRDAMGANAVNTMAERIAPRIEELTGGRVHLRIVSNLADRRLVTARATFPAEALATQEAQGPEVVERMLAAYRFALHDPYRAATNNKGVFNGVASVALATGQDFRAIEAGGHAYAAHASPTGSYASLTRFDVTDEGDLTGMLTLPLAVGTVGGSTTSHPVARTCLRIMRVETARELAGVMVAVGLAQQTAAMRALATEGIQRGHMRLHARRAALRSAR
jgi:hydroxymethylglutaryl-CoA reductase